MIKLPKIQLAGGRRDLFLLGVLVVIAALWYIPSEQEQSGDAAPPADMQTNRPGVGAPASVEPAMLLHEQIAKRKEAKAGAGEEVTPSRRNPFSFPKPKPKPVDPNAPPPVPVKPRPVAEYMGYLGGSRRKVALIRINGDSQAWSEGARLPNGCTLLTVDPKEIILRDFEGESYHFPLPR